MPDPVADLRSEQRPLNGVLLDVELRQLGDSTSSVGGLVKLVQVYTVDPHKPTENCTPPAPPADAGIGEPGTGRGRRWETRAGTVETGVNADGHREVLGADVTSAEDGAGRRSYPA
jgi:hypothetical protein